MEIVTMTITFLAMSYGIYRITRRPKFPKRKRINRQLFVKDGTIYLPSGLNERLREVHELGEELPSLPRFILVITGCGHWTNDEYEMRYFLGDVFFVAEAMVAYICAHELDGRTKARAIKSYHQAMANIEDKNIRMAVVGRLKEIFPE